MRRCSGMKHRKCFDLATFQSPLAGSARPVPQLRDLILCCSRELTADANWLRWRSARITIAPLFEGKEPTDSSRLPGR